MHGNSAYSQEETVAESALRCVGSKKGEAEVCERSLTAAAGGGTHRADAMNSANRARFSPAKIRIMSEDGL
jgi:hypothetical protein